METLCGCGCGQVPKYAGAKFVHGHHLRLPEFQRRQRDLVPLTCENCEKPFLPAKRGTYKTARFCSKKCASNRGLVPRTCEHCNKPFTVRKSWLEATTSRGRFCSIPCRHAFQEQKTLAEGGDRSTTRKALMKSRGEKCEVCGYSKFPIVLVMHHKAGAGTETVPGNLEILCPTCHAERHLALGNTRLGPSHRNH